MASNVPFSPLLQIASLSLIIILQKKLSKTVTPAIRGPDIVDVSGDGRCLKLEGQSRANEWMVLGSQSTRPLRGPASYR